MKKNYLKSLCAATLATVLILSNSLCALAETPTVSGGDTPAVASVSDNATDAGIATVSENGTTTPSTPSTPTTPETTTKTKLAAPTNPRWAKNYNMTWDAVTDAQGFYDVQLYKDGEVIYDGRWNIGAYATEASLNSSLHINESGVYKFRVRSSIEYYYGSDEEDNYTESDWVESPEITYTRPSTSLGSTVAYWDEGKPGYFHYNSVANAGGYYVEVYFTEEGEDEDGEWNIGASWSCSAGFADEAGRVINDDITWRIESRGAGRYRVKIRALSGDLDKYANGELGEFSGYYNTAEDAKAVADAITNALASGTPSQALDTLKNDISIDSMKIAMQTDDTVLNQMKDLESKYVAEKNISVKAPSVSSEASSYVDSSKISMVGAGLNVDAGAVQLEVGVPAKKEYVNTKHYKNTVQLAIELKHDNTSVHDLQVPITITMPIPAGLNASRLAILHYHEDGTFESVNLKNNGDGTVTFTVTSFSTFVFAEEGYGFDNMGDGDSEYYESDEDDDDGVVTSGDMTAIVDWDAEGKKVDAAVASGKVQNVDIFTGKDVKAPLDLMNKIAGKKVTLALHTGNGVTISVSGTNNRTVKNPVDLLVTEADGIPDSVKNSVLVNAVKNRTIHIEAREALTAKVNLHVNVGAENVGKRANLYCYDEISKSMKLVGTYVINKDGQAMFCLTRSGDFLVTITNGAPTAVAGGYTVIAGDTLSGIAARHGVSLKNLVAANPQISDANKIYPGQVINLK